MFVRYAVEIGDSLWNALYNYLHDKYPGEDGWGSTMRIEGIYEESGNKFAIVSDCNSGKYYRINFDIEPEFTVTGDWIEVEKEFVPVSDEGPQFSLEAYEAYENGLKESVEEPEAEPIEEPIEEPVEEPINEKFDKPEDKVDTYNLDEIPEYIELNEKFSALTTEHETLQQSYSELKATNDNLIEEINTLKTYKMNVERKEKEAMIDSFYMLSDEDKKDVVANIDNYSLDDIEAKLSIICVRNKVNFDLDDDNQTGNTTFNLNGDIDTTPAWIKAVQAVAETMD